MRITKTTIINKQTYLKQTLGFIDFLFKFITSDPQSDELKNIFPNGIIISEKKGAKQEEEPAKNFEKLAKKYNYEGQDLDKTNKFLFKISCKINEIINSPPLKNTGSSCCSCNIKLKNLENELKVSQECLNILRWGGVETGAFKFFKLLSSSNLVNHLLKSKSFFSKVDEIDLNTFERQIDGNMNASWSKVYSLTCATPFLIFDSRVSAALQFLAGIFSIKEKFTEIPSCLQFPALESRSEEASRQFKLKNYEFKILSLYRKEFKHAIWNLQTNWIIEKVIEKMTSEFCGYNQSSVEQKFYFARSIEAGLFMLGYDLNTLKDQVNDDLKHHMNT